MDEDDVGPLVLESLLAGFAAMRGAIIDDPEHPWGRKVRGLTHDLVDEALEGDNAGRGFAPAVDLGAAYVPSGQVGPGATPFVLKFNAETSVRARLLRGVATLSSLDAGFFVGAENAVVRAQRLALPESLVEVQNAPRFGFEVRVARKDPTAITPGLDGVFGEPAPQRRISNRGDKTSTKNLSFELWDGVARQRQALPLRELTGQGFDSDDDAGGESGLDARRGVARAALRGAVRRTVCATC
jgi:hypothetical protein